MVLSDTQSSPLRHRGLVKHSMAFSQDKDVVVVIADLFLSRRQRVYHRLQSRHCLFQLLGPAYHLSERLFNELLHVGVGKLQILTTIIPLIVPHHHMLSLGSLTMHPHCRRLLMQGHQHGLNFQAFKLRHSITLDLQRVCFYLRNPSSNSNTCNSQHTNHSILVRHITVRKVANPQSHRNFRNRQVQVMYLRLVFGASAPLLLRNLTFGVVTYPPSVCVNDVCRYQKKMSSASKLKASLDVEPLRPHHHIHLSNYHSCKVLIVPNLYHLHAQCPYGRHDNKFIRSICISSGWSLNQQSLHNCKKKKKKKNKKKKRRKSCSST
eukprot:m.16398 g.16398  ORF g.16398 m.16398 type:complete len:322 (+) comp8074_c0_seq1:160-1125(+)